MTTTSTFKVRQKVRTKLVINGLHNEHLCRITSFSHPGFWYVVRWNATQKQFSQKRHLVAEADLKPETSGA